MEAVTGPEPPRLAAAALPTLAEATLGDDIHERECFARVDLGGRSYAHGSFVECGFEGVRLDGTDLAGTHFGSCVLTEVEAPHLAAGRSSWRRVRLARSRVGAADLYEAEWRSVTVEDCKIGYLNARAARWHDVAFADCILDELDLGGATVTRMALAGCRIGTLHLAGATLTDVDLRGAVLGTLHGLAGLAGATVTEEQLAALAPLLAAHLRIRIA